MTDFSVSICTYDGDSDVHLRQALMSIIDQTVVPSEVILVIDGPIRPELECVVGRFSRAHHFVKVVRLEVNAGHGNARRVGLENCTHEIVALMDADDVSLQDRFEKQLQCFASDPNLSLVGGSVEEFQVINGEDIACSVRALPESNAEIRSMLKWRCPLNQPTVMFKRSGVVAAGGYLDWFCNEDYYLWVRMAINGATFANIPDVIVRFRIDQETYERRGGLRYFMSEAKLQKFMYRNGLSNIFILAWNISVRFGVQVICPSSLRKVLYTRLFRRRLVTQGSVA